MVLQSSLKQQATALKEKEFNLHHSNLSKYPAIDEIIVSRLLYSRVLLSWLTYSSSAKLTAPIVTVGTQAAVLAGLDVTMFIEFQPPANSEWVCTSVVDKLFYRKLTLTLTIIFMPIHPSTSRIQKWLDVASSFSITFALQVPFVPICWSFHRLQYCRFWEQEWHCEVRMEV